jgi:hypothetical protein
MAGALQASFMNQRSFGLTLTLSSTTANYNLFTAAGSPSTTLNVTLNIEAGVTVGGTGSSTALTVGQFPTGSVITINNNGNIDGFGGAAGTSGAGGNGGDAINANYANQTVVINNNVGANIRGGGGGGGKGGTGGTGGAGSFTQTGPGGGYNSSGCDASCAETGFTTCIGTCLQKGGGGRSCLLCSKTVSSSGGAGGAGGAGGVGQGYTQSQASGSAGSAGASGGTNAGAGGTGGTGGTGGVFGAAGSTGDTGSTGANGNAGSGGSGTSGSASGSSGRYLVKGANSVTLNNNGTVAGGLA